MSGLSSAARQLRAALAVAPDGAVGRVVAMLDGLVDRGEVDAVLDGVRPRLRLLRPARPLRFGRILLMPVEGALVPPLAWKGSPTEIPRSAIAAIVATAHDALGELAEEMEGAALGHNTDNTGLIRSLGGRLWPAAGRAALPISPKLWAESGVPPAAVPQVLALCGALWRHGAPLWAAREAAAEGPPEPILRAALAPLAAEGAAPLTAAMVLLVRHAARPGQVAAVATGLNAAAASAADREIAGLLSREAKAIAACEDPASAAAAAISLGRRLADLEVVVETPTLAGRRHQVATVRRDTAATCHARFTEALASRLLAPAAAACASTMRAADDLVARLEAAAWELHQLEAAGRRLGQEAAFDRSLREGVAKLAALAAAPGGLGRVELARLVEILAGPDAALPLLR
jgi:hypothetical protein